MVFPSVETEKRLGMKGRGCVRLDFTKRGRKERNGLGLIITCTQRTGGTASNENESCIITLLGGKAQGRNNYKEGFRSISLAVKEDKEVEKKVLYRYRRSLAFKNKLFFKF